MELNVKYIVKFSDVLNVIDSFTEKPYDLSNLKSL